MQKNRFSFFQYPSPFEFAIFLSFLVVVLASFLTNSSWQQNLNDWGDGLWSLLAFMTQMCLILLGGYVIAISKAVKKVLKIIVSLPQSNVQILLLTFSVSVCSCLLNWGLGLVVSAFFALEMARQHKSVHFPFLVASSYMGFIFWHAGLSGSIPLVISTPGNFSEKWLGATIPLSQTIFSTFNIVLILVLFVVLSFYILIFDRTMNKNDSEFLIEQTFESDIEKKESCLSLWLHWALIALMGFYILIRVVQGNFHLQLNQVNLLLIFVGLIVHKSSAQYIEAVKKGCENLAPILIQYPLYGGIMGVMIQSGLAVDLSNAFIAMSTEKTYAFFVFLSAGLLNIFVPSGGGQWAVQAPVVIEGAKQLGVPLWKAAMAVAWGDAWTNLIQPFWALPLLSIVNLDIKNILGHCFVALILSGTVIGGFFLFF